MKKIAVIGAGAAGMMAAIAAAQNGAEVSLYEKNEKPGKKLFITGKGRCNVTNACEVTELFTSIKRNPKFLYSAIYGFDNYSVIEFFENSGVKLKTERGGRVFPFSDHSSDIIGALKRQMDRNGVKCFYNCEIKGIETADNAVTGICFKDKRTEKFDSVILSTGGVSYITTGSTGDGIRWAKETGHATVDTIPSLVPLETEEKYVKDLMGLSLKNVNVTVFNGKKKVFSDFGEMLFTHYGVSGPLILSASAVIPEKYPLKLEIDLKPALDMETLDKRILRDFDENKNKNFENSLSGLFPSKLIPVMVRLSGTDPFKKVNSVTAAERQTLLMLTKHFPLTVTGKRGFDEAIITRGGVSVKCVNPSTLESRMVKGLYFAGEMLDVDALTGGFNLQIAWSTGYLAGVSAAEKN